MLQDQRLGHQNKVGAHKASTETCGVPGQINDVLLGKRGTRVWVVYKLGHLTEY